MSHSSFDDEPPPCPACDGPGDPIGRRGRLQWWACRDCGHQFYTPADEPTDLDVTGEK